MFGNNNDQNFNNQNPLFNNSNINQMNNDYVQNNIVGNESLWQNVNPNGYVAPVFNNEPNQFMNYNTNPDYNLVESKDTPPELGEIKNLSDATTASAPTMDVLGPMNIMPETLPASNDLLDQYENGTFNINNINTSPNTSGLDAENNSIRVNNFDMTNNNQLNTISDTTPITNNSFDNNLNNSVSSMPVYDFNQNIGMETSYPKVEPTLIPEENINQTITSGLDISSVGDYSNDVPNLNDLNLTSIEIENNNSNGNILVEDTPLGEIEANNIDLSNISIEEEKDYDIVQNEVLSETKAEENTLTNLGLDESYTEPDMLEIMDLDSEETEDLNIESPKSEVVGIDESSSVSANAQKIKSLIEELKLAGANIELEEFDFEHMYQLIVKLNK